MEPHNWLTRSLSLSLSLNICALSLCSVVYESENLSLSLFTSIVNIDSERKRKKPSSISTEDRADRTDKNKHKKKTKMSSSSDKVRASHILIKHKGSRRKASWKDPDGHVITSTTRESAVAQLKALRDDIVSGKAKFNDIAARQSDCSSAKRGGDLGQSCYSILLF